MNLRTSNSHHLAGIHEISDRSRLEHVQKHIEMKCPSSHAQYHTKIFVKVCISAGGSYTKSFSALFFQSALDGVENSVQHSCETLRYCPLLLINEPLPHVLYLGMNSCATPAKLLQGSQCEPAAFKVSHADQNNMPIHIAPIGKLTSV